MDFLNLKKKSKANEEILHTAESMDADEVLKKHDKEFRFRRFTGNWKYLIVAVSVFFMAYHLYTSRFGMPLVLIHRALHLGIIMFLIWAYFPATKNSRKDKPTVVDIFLMLITIATTYYTMNNISALALRGGVAIPSDYIIGAITMFLVLEATRRVVGKGLLLLALFFVLYAYFGRYFPGVFAHKGYRVERIIYQMYLGDQGIFGIPLGVSSTYLVVFILLGAMLDRSGLGKLFNDISMFVGGRLVGGPAKVSVIASALMGTISGSSATNVATTGAFTIPLMKSVGYSPAFAGAIEAAASTGGQIMPPIMGTVAFIMAEYLGVPYLTIAASAIIPALLYFAGVFFQIDLRARRNNLRGLKKEDLPEVKQTVLRYGHMIIPIIVLVFFLMDGFTPIYAAFYAIVLTFLLSWIRKETRIGVKEIIDICVNASRSTLSVGIAMACAGFIVAVLAMTGIGIILADNIVLLSRGVLFIALLLTMVVSIILGMGLPTSACYIISASIAVPILTQMGVGAFQAHFFVMYFSILSTVTPPVALSAYVGAGMAGADPNEVGKIAFRLAIAGFIVPFFFIYSPEMLLMSDSNLSIAWAAITGLGGTFLLAVAAEGYLTMHLPILTRLMFLASALTLIAPGAYSDFIGLALVVTSLLTIFWLKKNKSLKNDRLTGVR